jgi:membrane protein required for colicin V production
MNAFDAAVLVAVIALAGLGFRAGLLRSLADILGFIIAVPLAVALAPHFAPAVTPGSAMSISQSSLVSVGLLLGGGFAISQALRYAVSGMLGQDIHALDRMAGLGLGAVRALLVAVTVVLVFDQIIPSNREPPFLQGSKMRPFLSAAAQSGLRSLPSDVTAHIDQLKREHRI